MQERKLNIVLTTFPYAGNSTGSSLCWDTAEWLIREASRLKTDEQFKDRIDNVGVKAFADTPVTMVRNQAVQYAREIGADLLLMVDSDMVPDVHLRDGVDPGAVPFLDTAIDAIYRHYDKGPLVVCAPYCGPPPNECVYVFLWETKGNWGDESSYELRMYTRTEAQMMAGLHECAAQPTGLILFDMRIFNLIEPPYFFYEMKEPYEHEKASTEDVCSTRNMSMSCIHQKGYNPLLCAWSSWAGHRKNWVVGKPQKSTPECITGRLRDALKRPQKNERLIDIGQLIDADRFPKGGGHAARLESSRGLQRPAQAGDEPGEGGADRTIQNGAVAANGQAT